MQTKQHAVTRAKRIAAVGNAYRMRARNAKLAAHAAATQAYNQKAFMLAVQQLAAQHGVPAPTTLSVRAPNTNAQKHAPSAQSGACAQVRALAVQHNYNRAATLQACAAAGINPATAATQFANAKRAYLAAQ